jgi:hypothetical protein
MALRIESVLTIPPSSITCFRDATLYAKVIKELDILLECEKGTKSIFWKWIKDHGAHDYVDQLIVVGEEPDIPKMGVRDANIRLDRLTAESLPFAVSAINSLSAK